MTDLEVEQIDIKKVLVTWTEPPDSPEYQIRVHNPGGSTETFSGESPFIFGTTEIGVHIFEETYYDQDLPSRKAAVTVKGII